ncbi:hypothetical protein E2C01_091323 [Portunus trituberculatus]|uniref:Uncharacterized protein n=1 Tax=Portunus trituberculatus TaxID=210409 RepID=A0A5B7JP33_PORTR|nr:hypothetical protein [Portunus trituberculatus]
MGTGVARSAGQHPQGVRAAVCGIMASLTSSLSVLCVRRHEAWLPWLPLGALCPSADAWWCLPVGQHGTTYCTRWRPPSEPDLHLKYLTTSL